MKLQFLLLLTLQVSLGMSQGIDTITRTTHNSCDVKKPVTEIWKKIYQYNQTGRVIYEETWEAKNKFLMLINIEKKFFYYNSLDSLESVSTEKFVGQPYGRQLLEYTLNHYEGSNRTHSVTLKRAGGVNYFSRIAVARKLATQVVPGQDHSGIPDFASTHGIITKFEYDDLNRLIRQTRYDLTGEYATKAREIVIWVYDGKVPPHWVQSLENSGCSIAYVFKSGKLVRTISDSIYSAYLYNKPSSWRAKDEISVEYNRDGTVQKEEHRFLLHDPWRELAGIENEGRSKNMSDLYLIKHYSYKNGKLVSRKEEYEKTIYKDKYSFWDKLAAQRGSGYLDPGKARIIEKSKWVSDVIRYDDHGEEIPDYGVKPKKVYDSLGRLIESVSSNYCNEIRVRYSYVKQ